VEMPGGDDLDVQAGQHVKVVTPGHLHGRKVVRFRVGIEVLGEPFQILFGNPRLQASGPRPASYEAALYGRDRRAAEDAEIVGRDGAVATIVLDAKIARQAAILLTGQRNDDDLVKPFVTYTTRPRIE